MGVPTIISNVFLSIFRKRKLDKSEIALSLMCLHFYYLSQVYIYHEVYGHADQQYQIVDIYFTFFGYQIKGLCCICILLVATLSKHGGHLIKICGASFHSAEITCPIFVKALYC